MRRWRLLGMLMRSNQDDDAIDAAIAEAARSLTAAAPSSTLRAAVRDRIERPSLVALVLLGPPKLAFRSFVASAFRRKKSWWLVPVGAMVAVSAVTIVGRTFLGPPGGPDRVRPKDVRSAIDHVSSPLETVGRTLSGPAASGGPERVRPTVTPPPIRRVAATFVPTPEELEPLIPPLTIPLLETKQIAVDTSSGVMPIEIIPLRIEPLQGE